MEVRLNVSTFSGYTDNVFGSDHEEYDEDEFGYREYTHLEEAGWKRVAKVLFVDLRDKKPEENVDLTDKKPDENKDSADLGDQNPDEGMDEDQDDEESSSEDSDIVASDSYYPWLKRRKHIPFDEDSENDSSNEEDNDPEAWLKMSTPIAYPMKPTNFHEWQYCRARDYEADIRTYEYEECGREKAEYYYERDFGYKKSERGMYEENQADSDEDNDEETPAQEDDSKADETQEESGDDSDSVFCSPLRKRKRTDIRNRNIIVRENINDRYLFLTYHGIPEKLTCIENMKEEEEENQIHVLNTLYLLPKMNRLPQKIRILRRWIPNFNDHHRKGTFSAMSRNFYVVASPITPFELPESERPIDYKPGLEKEDPSTLKDGNGQPLTRYCQIFVQDITNHYKPGHVFNFKQEIWDFKIISLQIVGESILLIFIEEANRNAGLYDHIVGDLHIFNLKAKNIKESHKTLPHIIGFPFQGEYPVSFGMLDSNTLCLVTVEDDLITHKVLVHKI